MFAEGTRSNPVLGSYFRLRGGPDVACCISNIERCPIGDDPSALQGGIVGPRNEERAKSPEVIQGVRLWKSDKFAGPLALQPELRYIQRGYGVDVTFTGLGQEITAEGTLKLDYIDVPVLARFEFPSAGITPHVFAGPTVGFNVSAEQETEAMGNTETEDISDTVSGTDFGLEFGGGVDFGIGAGTVTVDARYGLGLTDIPDTDNSDFSLTNRALMVTAGFAF